MALFLSEDDVCELLPMERALECVEASFFAQGTGQAINRPRKRILLPHSSLHYMAAALPAENWLGMKIYTVTPSDMRFGVLLFDVERGELKAVIQADHLGRIRTGAASGVATRYLARANASRVGLIGTGRQARTQLEAVTKVLQVSSAKVFGRDEKRRQEFCREMQVRLGVQVEPATHAEEAVRFGEVIITATTAREPVVLGEWLQPGTHVNAIGANMLNRRELDTLTLARASLIAVDSLEQAQEESADLIQGLAKLARGWEGVVELSSVMSGSGPRRRSQEEITIFKSGGIALWDVAVAAYVYQQARQKEKGKELDLF
jgi:ornithine cyclodeaminase/alanine dehydrogenase-like protein (mu-crystallin family)